MEKIRSKNGSAMRSKITSSRLICHNVVNIPTSAIRLINLFPVVRALTLLHTVLQFHILNPPPPPFFFLQLPGGERDSPHESQEGEDGEKEAGAKESLKSGGSSAGDGAAEQEPEQAGPAQVQHLLLGMSTTEA